MKRTSITVNDSNLHDIQNFRGKTILLDCEMDMTAAINLFVRIGLNHFLDNNLTESDKAQIVKAANVHNHREKFQTFEQFATRINTLAK